MIMLKKFLHLPDLMLEKLMNMKKELARKERKLKKCVRASSAKEYVKRRLREQEVLEGKASAVDLTSDLCLPPEVSSITCQTYSSPCSAVEEQSSSKHLSAQNNNTEKLPVVLPQKAFHPGRSNKTSPFVSISPNHYKITQPVDLSTEPELACNITLDTRGSFLKTSHHEGSTTSTTAMKSGSCHGNSVERNSQHTAVCDVRNLETISVDRITGLQPDMHKSADNSKNISQNNKTKHKVFANTCRLGTNSKGEMPLAESDSDKGLNWNSSSESVSSAEHQGRRSLSLKRKRNVSSSLSPPKSNKCELQTINTNLARSKCVMGSTASETVVPVNLPVHSVVRCIQTTKNNRILSDTTDSLISDDDEKVPEVILKQKETMCTSKQQYPTERLKKPDHTVERPKKPETGINIQEGTENSRIKRKSVKRKRRTIGRILDVDLEKEINFPASSESSQNSEEYETLLLIQQSYRSGVDYSTRHGKTHNLPSMLSSIFQYFIDENRRQKEPSDFSLPEDQFGRMMRKRLKRMSGEFSNYSQHEDWTPKIEHQMDESGLNSVETSQDLFHPDTSNRQGMESVASCTDHTTKLKRKSDIHVAKESVDNFVSSNQQYPAVPKVFETHFKKTSDVDGGVIVPITDLSPLVSVPCPQISSDHTQQEHSKGYSKTNSDYLCKKQPFEKQNSSANNEDIKLSSICSESEGTPKCDSESCVYSEDFVPMSPALFASPTDRLGTEDSSSVGEWDSQDSQLIHTRRSNKGEKLKHLGCIKLSPSDSVRCVAACCIQISRRRTDVVLCIGQSAISLWNQTGDTYTCVKSWQLEQGYSSVECYTYPAVFRDKFCYFVVVLRGVRCTVLVVHYNVTTDKPQLIQCLQGNSVTACCLSVEALAVGQTNQDTTTVTKYSVDCDGQLMVEQEFDPSPDDLSTPRCLMLVENLPSALILWSSNNTLVLWNTDTGTLVWTLDLSLTWPEMSTLVSVQWWQEYLLLSLLTEKKSADAGVLLVVNPETEISKVVIRYNATSWAGLKCVSQLQDSIAATDRRGQTCVWEPYSGQLSYQCDPSTGVKGLGHYWRKVIAMYNHCVHIFQ